MVKDCKYAAWFRTKHGQGTGVVYLKDGTISGGDSFFDYSGSYEVDRDSFTATLITRRCAAGPSTVFGVDEVEVVLTGELRGTMAICSGTSRQAPGVIFEATLIPSQEVTPSPELNRAVVKLNADKLPKGVDQRFRGRHPSGV